MTIRRAEPADLDAIADIAQDQRIRHEGWQPEVWPLAANARTVHRVAAASALDDGTAVTLVAATGTKVQGYVMAVPARASGSPPATWVVIEFGVAKPKRWDTVGRVLLAALSGRAHRAGVQRIVVPCPAGDRRRRAALDGARLDLNCWFRHLRLDHADGVSELPPDGCDEPGFPLPHLHGLVDLVASTAESITADGAHALLTPSQPPAATVALAGNYAIADPVIANDGTAMWAALDRIEAVCRDRHDVLVLVAVGPGEEPLDQMLDRRGYGRPLEWWTIRPA